ncbi:hypothetical protein, partial [Bacillus subtilis]|uniref:hypothetical protein n=1 Tax=Bacillus subtilis TaxID=1423 RepID=UPI001BDBA2E6
LVCFLAVNAIRPPQKQKSLKKRRVPMQEIILVIVALSLFGFLSIITIRTKGESKRYYILVLLIAIAFLGVVCCSKFS